MKKYIIIVVGFISIFIIVGILFMKKDSNIEVIWDNTSTSYINLNEDSISLINSNAKVNKTKVTIISGGVYEVTGKLNDGSIIVDTKDSVQIILNDANINCSNSSPIYIKSADKVTISLKENTTNTLTDGTDYKVDSENEPDGTIFSKDDLIIDGLGSLIVNSNYKDAIVSKDDLTIINGNITINSNDDGIRGKDSITIKNGNFTINSKTDGIKTTNDTDSSKGNILIENGIFNITSLEDGIKAESNIQIDNGSFTINSGGGSTNSSTNSTWGNWNNNDTSSSKAIKATNLITINNGTFLLDSSDDAIHSNNEVIINNGDISIISGDDGIHSDKKLTINNGNIVIDKSYEGIESSELIFNGGDIRITASDDGINAAGGVDNSASSTNRRGGMNFTSTGKITINDGYIYVDSKGDGIDSNGSITMKNGTVIVNGPTDNGNGALDYDSTFNIDGGLFIAAGSSGMAQGSSNSSLQNSVLINFNSNYSNNTLVNIKDSNNVDIITFAPSKTFSSIFISSKDLSKNNTYNIYTGGSSNGDNKDGLYSGNYINGTKYTSFSITNTSTTIGNSMMGGLGNGMGRR